MLDGTKGRHNKLLLFVRIFNKQWHKKRIIENINVVSAHLRHKNIIMKHVRSQGHIGT